MFYKVVNQTKKKNKLFATNLSMHIVQVVVRDYLSVL